MKNIELQGDLLPNINPDKYHHGCFLVSEAMTRLLRHDQSAPQEDAGAVLVDDTLEEFKKKKVRWCFDWTSILAKGGGSHKERKWRGRGKKERNFRGVQERRGGLGEGRSGLEQSSIGLKRFGLKWSQQCTVSRRIY